MGPAIATTAAPLRRILRRAALAGAAFLVFGHAAIADTASPREQAVAEARAGHPDVAIQRLREMLAQGSSDPLVPMDLAVLLYQSGQAQAATEIFERAKMPNPPEYALLAMSRAYRDQRRFDIAERLARAGAHRFAQDGTWPVLLALILADEGRSDEALQVLATPQAASAVPVDYKRAEAYVYLRAGRKFDALRAYMEALQLAPDDAEARAAAAGLLREIGGPHGAVALTEGAPPLPLGADAASAKVRWGSDIRPSDPAQRFIGTDAAIQELDRLIAQAKSGPKSDPQLLRRLRLDRMVALRDRVRMAEVIAESDALRAEGGPLPPYAERARADALLYLRRPKEASAAYQSVVSADPSDLDARYGLFYAEVEAEDFDAAYRTIDQLLADQPPWRSYKDDPSRYSNPDYTDAALATAQARLYGNQLDAAQERMAPLVAGAPANAGIRGENAALLDARGWPRAAESEARIAASLDPVDPGIEKTQAALDLERHRYAAAAQRIAKLQALYPEDVQVQQLARQLQSDQGSLFELEVRPSWSRGGGTNAAGNELTVNAKLWSPPVDDHWRAFAFDDYSYGHPEEGFVQRHHAGAGAELRFPDVTATAYGTYSAGELEKPGGGFTVDWSPDDHLQLGLAGEIFSVNTPLRALFSDTTADEIGGHATYRWHESREVNLFGSYLNFSDGNEQTNIGANVAQRLVDIPHFDLTGRLDVSSTANTKQDVAYYSPERDLTATGGLLAEHVLWRSYEDSLVQAFTLEAGVYDQKGFGADWIGSIGYEHRWRFDPTTEFHYGVSLGRAVFDGDPEESLAFTFGLKQSF